MNEVARFLSGNLSPSVMKALEALPVERPPALLPAVRAPSTVTVYKPKLSSVITGQCASSHRPVWLFQYDDGTCTRVYEASLAHQMCNDLFPAGPPSNGCP